MQFSVLALDYDGTIAQDGVRDPEVRQTIPEVQARGVRLWIIDDLGATGGQRLRQARVDPYRAQRCLPAASGESPDRRSHANMVRAHQYDGGGNVELTVDLARGLPRVQISRVRDDRSPSLDAVLLHSKR